MTIFSIATVCLSGALDEKFEAIARAGFTSVEIFESDLTAFGGSPRDIRAMADGLGLKIAIYQPFRDFEGMPDDRRAKTFARAERKFDLMQELGCELLMVCSNVSPQSLGGVDRAARDLRALAERAAARGLRVGFEALAWGRHISDYRDAWEAVRRADHPALGLVLDSFHTLARKTDLGAMRAVPGDRIFLVQLADAPNLEMDYLSWSRHFRSFPGQGELPIFDFMEALRATGYDGPVSLEIFNDEFRAGAARRVAADGHRSLVQLFDDLGRRQTPAPPPPTLLPPRARSRGVEFIEFALDDAAAARFEALLTSLGFRKAGVHRSKPVTRWTQGAINIIVNLDRQGFARSYNIMHGTSVCAICLRVDDAAAAAARAAALNDEPFRQPVGPGELTIPAVRGLGASLLYFVDGASDLDRWWTIDFVEGGDPVEAGAGLTSVDHIAQSMFYDEMLNWLLFYTSLFDLARMKPEDVIDPGGLVRSQALQSPDGDLRIVLNASQSNRTLSSRFLSEYFGSGVQHMAFATQDILATARGLRGKGAAILPIPPNYYADLLARGDLPEDAVAELRANDILYDRDAHGEFLHLYTPAFDERFFFEVVERRSYDGYGAANSFIRLAVQARLAAKTNP